MKPRESPAEADFAPARPTTNPLRLALLLICLLASLSALLDVRTGWFGPGESGAQTAGAQRASPLFGAGCPGRDAPRAASLAAADVAALRGQLVPIVPTRLGRVYEAGPIATSNLWTDDEPRSSPPSGAVAPAGYEVRWWALDRDGREDDVVADVLQFATAAEAQDALARAASPHCRRDGVARAASFPAGAHELEWLNPDKAWQRDVLFARGPRLYRVGDAPPGLLAVTGPTQSSREWRRAGMTAQVLACALPEAGCAASESSLADTSLPLLARTPGAGPPPSAAQAGAYAHAVNLRKFDLPGTIGVAPEGPTHDRGFWEAFVRCTGVSRSLASLATIHSPEFASFGAGEHELVYSTVAVLETAALAARYMTVLEGVRARTCIARSYGRSLLARAGAIGLHQLGPLTITQLPTPVGSSYLATQPYRAIALRLSAAADYTSHTGTHYSFPLYIQGFAFAYGRAVVELAAITFGGAFPAAREQFLESQLVGSAEANEALLSGTERARGGRARVATRLPARRARPGARRAGRVPARRAVRRRRRRRAG